MTVTKKILYITLTVASIALLPLIGSWIAYNGIFPPDYFVYPPPKPSIEKAGFNIYVFVVISIIFLGAIMLYVCPKLFGFKSVEVKTHQKSQKIAFPIWFWAGLLMWGVTLVVLWGKFSEPKWFLSWVYWPLFWGATLMLDGWLYVRNQEKSLVSYSPQTFFGLCISSIWGWVLFEYLNFFVGDNWYYPFGKIISNEHFTIYAVIGSSGLMPPSILLYLIFNTFRGFKERYQNGIKITLPNWLKVGLFVVCLVGMFLISFFPDRLFFILWVSPLILLSVLASWLDIRTPLTPIKEGNWAPTLLFSLTYLVYGFCLECWNYFSGIHEGGEVVKSYNPSYWVYSIPYVDVLHIFEMPLLGFLGYLPFGLYCGVWWAVYAFWSGIPMSFSEEV